jgi:hypothetical protein
MPATDGGVNDHGEQEGVEEPAHVRRDQSLAEGEGREEANHTFGHG